MAGSTLRPRSETGTPSTFTRPAAISVSQWRREPMPAWARYLLRRSMKRIVQDEPLAASRLEQTPWRSRKRLLLIPIRRLEARLLSRHRPLRRPDRLRALQPSDLLPARLHTLLQFL